ncbi:MAG: hypothetical protein ACRD09_13575, partial [Vicinamibacterales bacterium]
MSPLPTRRRACLLALSCLAACAVQAAAQPVPDRVERPVAELPRVRLVATGGTISNRNGGRLTAEELIKSVTG